MAKRHQLHRSHFSRKPFQCRKLGVIKSGGWLLKSLITLIIGSVSDKGLGFDNNLVRFFRLFYESRF